ncbi:hypothetical protein ABEB36_005234 [Hypothenemus hampei]|uniref:USP domain-containing protein n=1 Tax=Hypothenemus hampei TaxID=57062 RepID=A0ABD1EXH9_HYPHA
MKRKLKELFSELQHSRAKALPPDSLRKALADSFLDQQKFQIGFMDDAAECFENMLLRIHDHIAHKEPQDACSAPHCISHQKFAMTLVEQSVCGNCGATTEPMSFTQMVQYVSTSTLVHQLRISVNQTGRPDSFGRLLQKAGNMGDSRQCPATCGSVTQMCRILMNRPEIVSIGLVWNSEKPTIEHIMEVFSCINTKLNLSDVFSTVTDSRWAETTTHNLVGVVTYYGKHYSTFFFHTKLMEWIFLDDATVRDVGPRWEQVVEKCRKGKFQPLLLLYATPDSTPINLDYAPKINTPFYVDRNKNHPQTINQQQFLRRSVTPSPEKPHVGTTRRAITPNPENSPLNHKPPLPKPYNEYQNLSIIQKNLSPSPESSGCDQIDGCIIQKPHKPQINIHRTLSNGSSSGVESGVSIPDHLNIPRRRDSGNWSGDRNSASSASSTTMENPYLYLVGKMPHGSLPGSPTRIKTESLGNGAFDAGYDSYSLSSNDSTNMTTLQHMMKTGHLAQIPEDYSNSHIPPNQNSQSCDVLCDEADELLVKSRQLEDAHDLVLALALCNAAATKARAAMNAPYNNPQTLTLARMKHNTCIMRARSLHRRMTQTQPQNKENNIEIRHTREGSSGSGRHSRQNSKDKSGQHSRQNSRELLVQQEKEKTKPMKNIEIYATLPKKKDALKAKMNSINIEDEEYMLYNKAPERESRSIFSRSKNKDLKVKEKRSRSEDRNKISRGDFSVAPEIIGVKDTLKKAKENKEKEDKKEKDGKNKKQHKIRRKLLMGGLIRRKNRSMPDLTDANSEEHCQSPQSIDDANVGLRASPQTVNQSMNGYLSEGHLEFTGTNGNPNLERSKLMRKSFHGSAGKILTAAKVPPPPPLRTTSQLSRSKSNVSEEAEKGGGDFNIYRDVNVYHNLSPFNKSQDSEQFSMSLPYYGNSNNSYDDDSSFANSSSHTVVTQADVHQEQESPDEVDCMPSHVVPILELPPYPSPSGSVIHSRQASEEFPPPPPPLDLSALDEHLPKTQDPEPNSLLAQLQNKRKQILTQENYFKMSKQTVRSSGDTWLKELQAKQAALRNKKNEAFSSTDNGVDEVNTQRILPGEATIKSVKDLASKFECTELSNKLSLPTTPKSPLQKEISTIDPEQIAEEIREVEMITSAVNKVFGAQHEPIIDEVPKSRGPKKKSVSFCDQVILVATAEEQEEDTYIPNPILERVLRSAVNNPEANSIKQELMVLRENNSINQSPSMVQQQNGLNSEILNHQQPNGIDSSQYLLRNSMEHLLGKESPSPKPIPVGYYNQNHIQQNGYLNNDRYNNYREGEMIGTNQQFKNEINGGYYNGHHNLQQQQQMSIQNNYYNRGTPEMPLSNTTTTELIQNRNYQPSPYDHQNPYVVDNVTLLQNHYAPMQFQQNGYVRQNSSYQSLPQNSVMHPNYYAAARQQQRPQQNVNNYGYSPSPRPPYQSNGRVSAPSSYLASTVPPSPVPSISSCNNYHPDVYRNSPSIPNMSVYQRVPIANGVEYPNPIHFQPNDHQFSHQTRSEVYQRVPPSHGEQSAGIYTQNPKFPAYQRVPSPKHNLKKTVSFQPGTKGCESPIPKAIVTPIVVNNANNSIPTDKTKCNLCRKKNVVALNVYCKDCEFYMSRFKPKT